MSLAKHLEHQRNVLQQFAHMLNQERQLLTEAEVKGQDLADLAAAKQTTLAQLERMEQQRSAAQSKLGYSDGLSGAEQAAMDAGCLPIWQHILDLAEQVKVLNQFNGDTIMRRMSHNQRLLNFLHEAAGHSLYGPDGQAKRRSSLSGL